MAKQVITLNESELKDMIKKSVVRYLKESADEVLDTPELAIHAANKANADKKLHPGRGKDSRDPEIRAKRDRQSNAFSAKAADLMNQELGNPDFHVSHDRGARTMKMTKGPKSAYLRPDSDFDATRLYDDEWAEGDAPLTMKDLDAETYDTARGMFDKFKGIHDRAAALDNRLEEKQTIKLSEEQLNTVIKESIKKILGK